MANAVPEERQNRRPSVSRLDVIVVASVTCFVALVAFEVYPLGGANSWIAKYRVGVLGTLSPWLLAVAIVSASAILATPFLARRYGIASALALLTVAFVGLDVGTHRPLTDQAWVPRVAINAFRHGNPFAFRAIEAGSTRAILEADRRTAAVGYWSVKVEERRVTTYPPGLAVFYHALDLIANANASIRDKLLRTTFRAGVERRALALPEDDRTVALATLIALVHLLAVGLIPLGVYAVAALTTPPAAALNIAVASCFVPAFHLYAASSDALFPVLGLLATWTALTAIRRCSFAWALVNVASLTLGTSMTFAMLPFVLLSALVLGTGSTIGSKRERRVLLFAWVMFGVIAYLLMRVLAFDFVERFLMAMRNNHAFYARAQRGYGEALLFNAVTFAAFTGVAIVSDCVAAVRADVRVLRGGVSRLDPAAHLRLVIAVVLAFLFLSGMTRGEVERNWMLFMPLVAIAGGPVFQGGGRRLLLHSVMSLAALVAMACAIEVSFVF